MNTKEIIKYLKTTISEKGNYCYSLSKETTKAIVKHIEQQDKEIERLNNIINELEHDFESYELEYLQETYQGSLADFIETELERIQELKGDDSNEL